MDPKVLQNPADLFQDSRKDLSLSVKEVPHQVVKQLVLREGQQVEALKATPSVQARRDHQQLAYRVQQPQDHLLHNRPVLEGPLQLL